MELRYSWWKEDNFYLGYIDEYPQYPTQGESLDDLENGLKEIYNWIKDGTLKLNVRVVRDKFFQVTVLPTHFR